MKKFTVILLVAATLLLYLVPMAGCGGEEDAVLIARAKELIPKTYEINSFFYIDGLPVKEGGESIGGYVPADMTSLAARGYTKIDDILSTMEGVWTSDYRTRFRESSLFTAVNTGYMQESKYCYERYTNEYNENNQTEEIYEGIWVSELGLPTRTDPTEYLLDTLAVKEKTARRARLTLDVIVTNHENTSETQRKQVTITLAKEESGEWLLDGSVVVKYFIKPTVPEIN